MTTKGKTYLVGRDAKTGRVVSAAEVYAHPEKYIVEKVTKDVAVPRELKYVVAPKEIVKTRKKAR